MLNLSKGHASGLTLERGLRGTTRGATMFLDRSYTTHKVEGT